MIKQIRASYFHNFKNAQYCALSDDPIPDYLENGDEVYIIDQGKIYYWDELSSSLVEKKPITGLPSGGTAGQVLSLDNQLQPVWTDVGSGDEAAPVILNTASGAIASFSDGADSMPIKKLVAQIEPVQDLHGYSNPWPAGGGMNLLFINSRVSQTTSGVTFTSDDDYVYLNGTKNGQSYVVPAALTLTLQAGTYYARAFAVSGTVTGDVSIYPFDGSNNLTGSILGDEKTFTLESETTIYIRFAVWNDGMVLTNYKIGIVVSKTSGIDKFYPYSNICPISGWTGANVTRTGKNIADPSKILEKSGWTESDGVYTGTSNALNSLTYENLEGRQACLQLDYYGSAGSRAGYFRFEYADGTLDYIEVIGTTWTHITGVSNANKVLKKVTFGYSNSLTMHIKHLQIELGSTVTAYEPYQGNQISVTFPETIYGGEDEVIGEKLKSTMKLIDLGTLSWSISAATKRFVAWVGDAKNPSNNFERANIVCSVYPAATAAQTESKDFDKHIGLSRYRDLVVRDTRYADTTTFKAAMSGVQLCYELAEPVEYTLTGNEMETLYGTNNIWANTGDIEVTYPADTKLYIDGKLAEIQATILENIGG